MPWGDGRTTRGGLRGRSKGTGSNTQQRAEKLWRRPRMEATLGVSCGADVPPD